MSLQVEKLEKNMAKLTIEVPFEEFDAAVQKAYLANRGKISIPGFRKGKAPRKMIEKMYGAGIFYEDAVNDLIPEAYDKEVDASELEIVSRPKIDVVQVEPGQPFIFTAEVALRPEVTLGEYKGIEVEKQSVEVSDEEIQKVVDEEREKNARVIDVDDRAVENGDMVVLDFEGFVDGEAFDGGKGEDYDLTIGSGSFIPGFEEQLIGAQIDEETEVNVTFPEEYHAKELAGKAAVFKCTVHEIKVKELPEADDEFAMDVSEFYTLDEYKEEIRKDLAEKKEAEAKYEKEAKVIEKIVEKASMEVPDAMVDSQIDRMVDEFAGRMQAQGLTLDQYFQFTGLTFEKLSEQMRPEALKRIQNSLVLEAIVAAEQIEISEEKLNEGLEDLAKRYGMEPDQIKDNEYAREQVEKDLQVQAAVDLVRDSAVEV